MRRSSSWLRICVIATAACTVPAGTAAEAKLRTFSSGTINRPIPDTVGGTGEEIGPSIRLKTRGRVKT